SLLGAAHVVQPETILRWHRIRFTAFWRWKSRKRAHAQAIAAIDLFVVPALTFERLFAFLVLGHGRRQLPIAGKFRCVVLAISRRRFEAAFARTPVSVTYSLADGAFPGSSMTRLPSHRSAVSETKR